MCISRRRPEVPLLPGNSDLLFQRILGMRVFSWWRLWRAADDTIRATCAIVNLPQFINQV